MICPFLIKRVPNFISLSGKKNGQKNKACPFNF